MHELQEARTLVAELLGCEVEEVVITHNTTEGMNTVCNGLDLKPGAELAIFRILQEALANALRHGGPGTHAVVTFTWTDEGLKVLVDDDGVRADALRNGLDPDLVAQQQRYTPDDDLAALTQSPTGRGITEMRERTELFGGVFTAAAVAGVGALTPTGRPSLGFRLHALWRTCHNGVHGVKL